MLSVLRFFYRGLVRGAVIENVLILISASRFSTVGRIITSHPVLRFLLLHALTAQQSGQLGVSVLLIIVEKHVEGQAQLN